MILFIVIPTHFSIIDKVTSRALQKNAKSILMVINVSSIYIMSDKIRYTDRLKYNRFDVDFI